MGREGELAGLFKVLSVETRLGIIRVLKGRSLCVNALASRVRISPAAVSQHLRILRGAGLVRAEKRGYYVHYSIVEGALARWRKLADAALTGHNK